MRKLTESQIRKIVKEEKVRLLAEGYLRKEIRKALVESNGRLDEGFFDKVTAALGKLGMGKITDKISSAYQAMQQKLGNDKEVPGIDALMGPLEKAKQMADQILGDMKKTPVTRSSGEEEQNQVKEKVGKMMQEFGKFLNQKLEGEGDVRVVQAMEMGPSQKKSSKAHQEYEALHKVWGEINSIWLEGKRRKMKDHLVQYDLKLHNRLLQPYRGKK